VAEAAHSELLPWVQRLLSEFDSAGRRAQSLAQGLSIVQLNWRPTQDTWSIGQCLQHLLTANEVYLPPLAASLNGQQKSRVQEIIPGWFGRWFIRSYIAPSAQSRRIRAPKKIEPSRHIEAAVVESFLRSNQAALQLVRDASDYDVNRIRFKNPFIPLLRFTVGTGLEIVSKHQDRHLLQAERV